VVWPEPCAEETPDPELLDDPEPEDPELPDDAELPEDPEPPEEPEPPEAELFPDEPELLPAEEVLPDPVPLAVVVPVWCADPGRAKAITPAPTRPAAPTVVVTARSRAWPRRLAAAAARVSGSAEFIGFPPWPCTTVWAPGVCGSCGSALTML
jgi:hypothetical protein